MDHPLDALGILRHFRPRLVAILVLAAFYFHPQLSTALLMDWAHEKAQRFTPVLTEAFESTRVESAKPRSER